MSSDLILVTGAGGYLALHVVDKFIKEGFKVRGTIRNLNDKPKVDSLRKIASEDKLEIVQADLLDDLAKWREVMKGVTIVIHVASPFPFEQPEDENVLIKPAVDGTQIVLRAAFEENVKRVVLTSSAIAIFAGHSDERVLTEDDWTILDKTSAYGRSKTLAEKAAWDFVDSKKKANEKCFELSVINPGLILGPRLSVPSAEPATSEKILLQFLNNQVEKVPNNWFVVCDIRDVTLAHYKAAFSDAAAGKRHLISTLDERIPVQMIAMLLRDEFEPKGYKIPQIDIDEAVANRPLQIKFDRSKMKTLLGQERPTSLKASVIDMANSLIEAGLVQKPQN